MSGSSNVFRDERIAGRELGRGGYSRFRGAGVLTSVLLQGGLGKSSALLGEHSQAWAPGVEAW